MRNSEAASGAGALWARYWSLLWTALLCMAGMAWLFQNSIERYWQQSWQSDSPMHMWRNEPAWSAGALVQARAAAVLDGLHAVLGAEAMHWSAAFNRCCTSAGEVAVYEPPARVPLPAAKPLAAPPPEPQPPTAVAQGDGADAPAADAPFVVRRGQGVFFVGDSLMQGVAPHVQAALTRAHHVKSINASRQSTGLAYPGFYNWEQVVRETFAQHKDIALMVVFLGPNDPWDMPNPAGGGAYLKFRTPQWEQVYRARVRNIVRVAQQHGARVIWLQVPNMKRSVLNEKVHYLNGLYASEVGGAGALFLPTNTLLGMKSDTFEPYADIPGRGRIKMRIDDGVHFTLQGQRQLAQAILALIAPEPEAQEAPSQTDPS